MADEAPVTTEQNPTTEAPANETVAPVIEGDQLNVTILGGDEPKPEVEAPKPDGEEAKADAPVVPEAYELKLPDDKPLDTEALAMATPVFKDMGLTNEAAQKLMPVAAQFAERIQTAANKQILDGVVAQRKEWADAAIADPEYGGANLEASKAAAAKFMDRVGRPGLRTILNDSGLGNHPDLLAAFAFAGKAISEDSDFHRPGASSAPRTREEKYYGSSA